MTDSAGRWPPLSVWVAAGLLLLPPLAGVGWLLVAGEAVAACVPAVWLLVVLVPAVALVQGEPAGFRASAGLMLLSLVLVGGVTLAGVGRLPGRGHVLLLLPAGGWVGMTAAFLWWPATRVWCGRLAPADPGGDDGP